MSYIDVIFSNGDLPSDHREQPVILATAWIVWGFQWEFFDQKFN